MGIDASGAVEKIAEGAKTEMKVGDKICFLNNGKLIKYCRMIFAYNSWKNNFLP